MFAVSKLLQGFTQPLLFVALLALAAWWLQPRRPRAARRLLGAAVVLGLLLGWVPLPDALLRTLEAQSPAPAPPADARWAGYAGVVVLGGSTEHEHTRAGNGQVQLGDAAERLTTAVALARAHPGLRVVHSGGDGTLLGQRTGEGDQAAQFFAEQGVPAERVQIEAASRTTAENARFSAALSGVDPAQPWLLLTSAWHMPRAIAAFRAAGWNVQPYAVDYRAGSAVRWEEYAYARSLRHWQCALHEMIGHLAYRLSGRA